MSDLPPSVFRSVSTAELAELYLVTDFYTSGDIFVAIQRRRSKDVLPVAYDFIRSEEPRRREWGASLLMLGIPEDGPLRESCLGALYGLLDDPEPSVVARVIQDLSCVQVRDAGNEWGRRLRAMGDDSSILRWDEPMATSVDVAPMARFAAHPDTFVRMVLAMSLQWWGDAISTQLLLALTEDDDADVRASAASSLGWRDSIGGLTNESVEALWRLGRDPDQGVRSSAVASLVKLREPGAEEAFVAELRWMLDQTTGSFDLHSMLLILGHRRAFVPRELRDELERRWKVSKSLGIPVKVFLEEPGWDERPGPRSSDPAT